MMVPIGWVIKDRVTAHGHFNLRIYKTKGLAERYSHGMPVTEVFINTGDITNG